MTERAEAAGVIDRTLRAGIGQEQARQRGAMLYGSYLRGAAARAQQRVLFEKLNKPQVPE